MQLKHDRAVATALLALIVGAVLAASAIGARKVDRPAWYDCRHRIPGACATAVRR